MADDRRIAYGAMCAWWGDIKDVGTLSDYGDLHLPCCPHCRGTLFEVESEEKWLELCAEFEANGHPGYVGFIKWLKGKCYPTFEQAQAVYRKLN
jgi:uncharacterized protein YbaR (Trm112 family)